MKKFLIPAIICISVISGFECKGPDGSQGPAGPSLTGTVTGFIKLIDQNDNLLTSRGGAVVTIGGLNLSDSTDSTGKWTFTEVPTGTYPMTFSCNGYGSYVINGQQVLGGGALYLGTIPLIQPQSFGIKTIDIRDTTNATYGGYIDITGSANDSIYSTGKKIICFLGTTSAVSSAPANYLYTIAITPTESGSFSRSVYPQELESAGFSPGDSVHIIVYGASEYYYTYYDPATGRSIFNGLSYTPSAVVGVVIP